MPAIDALSTNRQQKHYISIYINITNSEKMQEMKAFLEEFVQNTPLMTGKN